MLKIKNIEQLKELKNKNWCNRHIERDFEISNIEQLEYLLNNYKDNFAFGVTFDTCEYTLIKGANVVYIRNDDTYKYKDGIPGMIRNEYHLKDSEIENIINFITSKKDTNRRTRIKFIYIELEDEEKEIKDLINKKLIKYYYDSSCPNFIYLAENEKEILNKIKGYDYNIYSITEQMQLSFDGYDMTLANIWGDTVTLEITRIIDLISDNLYTYVSEDNQDKIFNSNHPHKELSKIVDKIGREQLKMQLNSLMEDVDKIKFE